MVINRTHLSWGIGTLVASAGATLLYLANNDPEVLRSWDVAVTLPDWFGPVPPLRGNVGATPLGLIYGTLALLIFIFAALLGWRRKHPAWGIGNMQTWLKAHIWLTLLTVPLVLFHCGFHGGGPMTRFLLGLYAFVMVSGFWGLALQHLVPKLMCDYLPEEVIFEEIPYIRSQLVSRVEMIRDDIASRPEEALREAEEGEGGNATRITQHMAEARAAIQFIDREALPFLKALKTRPFVLRNQEASDGHFRLLRLQVPKSVHLQVEQLQDICDEKRRLDLQTRLHYWLHGWLIVHAPASILLVVLTVVHAIVATFIYA